MEATMLETTRYMDDFNQPITEEEMVEMRQAIADMVLRRQEERLSLAPVAAKDLH